MKHDSCVQWLTSPLEEALPEDFPSPFAAEPHPGVRRIGQALQAQLRSGWIAHGVGTERLNRPEGGKMFGVLVAVSEDGRWGLLKAFSGQLGSDWFIPGYAPPVFEVAARQAIETAAERRIKELTGHIERWTEAQGGARRLAAMKRLRRYLSREAMRRIYGTYVFENLAGRRKSLLELFGGNLPPWGAGDCAAPKLLATAIRCQLRPVAMAEFWWGPAPRSQTRAEGEYYAACAAKCGPILPFLLEGVGRAKVGR